VKPSRKRELADDLIARYRAGIRQFCAALQLPRSVYFFRSTARDSSQLKARISEIAATRVPYGYRRVHVLLRREGFTDNHKRVYRLYREQGLSL
jgi:putative transposase